MIVLEGAVIVLRFLQYGGAAILFGSSLFFLYALPRTGPVAGRDVVWSGPLLLGAAVILALASALGFLAQTVTMAGSLHDGLTLSSLAYVAENTGVGRAALLRALAALMALVAFASVRSGREQWIIATAAGAIACISFGWMGHGAASEGYIGLIHLGADIVHAVAACVWIGALVAFLCFLWRAGRASEPEQRALYGALHGFAEIGSFMVALVFFTGLMNSLFLVGWYGWRELPFDQYGQLLIIKLALFLAMIGLASVNRFGLTPALGRALDAGEPAATVLARLRRSVVLETAAAFAILALVAWLGTLAPIQSP